MSRVNQIPDVLSRTLPYNIVMQSGSPENAAVRNHAIQKHHGSDLVSVTDTANLLP